ncbi:hypothetical protein CYMTET_27439 [Cymbomonas tetramitiformis]|uniref:Uncharacterized protein n=1 Tax=Cymbomonas tetramitiformis TaxID=36881 RepID=A0AAE0FPV1_9CHLO|nr:hypothetical protein CYMTET_27439 [Cymbomonas tetramitiformis]
MRNELLLPSFMNGFCRRGPQEEKMTGLPIGVTEPKGWVQFFKGPDAVEWQESDHKEECDRIDVKQAILPMDGDGACG